MLKFSEELLQFIWKHRLLRPGSLVSARGKEIIVLKPGDHNTNSGPDFFNAQVNVDGLILAGNIEIHLRTSDWLKHHHQQDPNYDKLILHVVYEHDLDLPQNIAHGVEVLEVKELIDESTIIKYQGLVAADGALPCAAQLASVNDFKFSNWLQRMTVERLELKQRRVQEIFRNCNGDFIQTFYTLLLRNFGFQVNGLPFEMLANVLPVRILLRHADNLLQVECLLLGSSGLLQSQYKDQYIHKLQNEYEFLSAKYKLAPLNPDIFKFSRLRPANFPTLRLAELASVLHSNPSLVFHPENFDSVELIKKAMRVKPGSYWQCHYFPDGKLSPTTLGPGTASIENIVINSFAPFFFFYGATTGREEFKSLALELLESCAPEQNSKTKLFSSKTKSIKTAGCSQGLIHLLDNYCNRKRCLNCAIGMEILKPLAVYDREENKIPW